MSELCKKKRQKTDKEMATEGEETETGGETETEGEDPETEGETETEDETSVDNSRICVDEIDFKF